MNMDILNTAAAWATIYSSLINFFLAAFLVFLTGWYAVVTMRMWREMVESRLAKIRPLLHVRVGRPNLTEEDDRTIRTDITLQNFGSGPAYAVRSSAALRYEKNDEKTWIESELDLPAGLSPGQQTDAILKIGGFPTPMDESKREFFEVKILYQDSESNYYSLRQVYDLRAFDLATIVSRTWQMRYEVLKFKRPDRKRVKRDFRQAYPDADMETIMEYRLEKAEDWSRYQR